MSAALAGHLPHLDDDPRFQRPKPAPVAAAPQPSAASPSPPTGLTPPEPYAHQSRNRGRLKQPRRKVISIEVDPQKRLWWIVTLECTHFVRVFCARRYEVEKLKDRKCRACVAEALTKSQAK